jgi:hypothetical protein
MSRGAQTIDRSAIAPDTPLRLDVAAGIAFPDGSMTRSGLRREIRKGRLESERIAGKQYVTLAGINRMRQQCREDRKAPASTSANDVAVNPSGSYSTERLRSAQAAAQMIANGLKGFSPNISDESTSPKGKIVTLLR